MTPQDQSVAAIVIGGTGYVSGELLRLILGHPQLELHAVASESQAGTPIAEVFPHLASVIGDMTYVGRDTLSSHLNGKVAVFSAAPHGASAKLISELIETAKQNQCEINIVDASADFRFTSAAAWEAVYGQAHGAPDLLASFGTGLPEHVHETDKQHIGHPGCFATAMLLGSVPLLSLDMAGSPLNAFGITGSTGSGRTPIATTHHPFRHANLYAYKPLEHRHASEVIEMCAAASGKTPLLNFVPHSGPFARGIHMTIQTTLTTAMSADEVKQAYREFYAEHPFVTVVEGTPRLKDVVGTNHAQIGIAVNGDTLVVFCVIDNLVKGAAGGALQWMNRLLGFPETAGLTAVAAGWL